MALHLSWLTTNRMKAARLRMKTENTETSGLQDSSAFFARSYEKKKLPTVVKEPLFCKINLKKTLSHNTLKKCIRLLPQILSLQTFSGS